MGRCGASRARARAARALRALALGALATRALADDVLVDYEDAELRRFTCQGYHIASPPFAVRADDRSSAWTRLLVTLPALHTLYPMLRTTCATGGHLSSGFDAIPTDIATQAGTCLQRHGEAMKKD